MDKQELWRMHACMSHGYCRGRTLHIAWNCWCILHIYIRIVPIFLRIHIWPWHWASQHQWNAYALARGVNLGIGVKVEIQSPLYLLKYRNSLEHSNHVTATKKQRQLAWVQLFICIKNIYIYRKTFFTIIFKLTTSFDWRDLLERLLDLAGDFSEWSLHSCGGL